MLQEHDGIVTHVGYASLLSYTIRVSKLMDSSDPFGDLPLVRVSESISFLPPSLGEVPPLHCHAMPLGAWLVHMA